MLPHKLARGQDAIKDIAPTREFLLPTTREREVSFPQPSGFLDSSPTANSAFWVVWLTRLGGNTSTSSLPWRLSARSRPPSTTRRSVLTPSSRTRPRAKSRPRLPSTKPLCRAAALTVFELLHLILRMG